MQSFFVSFVSFEIFVMSRRSRGSLPPSLKLQRDLAEAPTARRRALSLVRLFMREL